MPESFFCSILKNTLSIIINFKINAYINAKRQSTTNIDVRKQGRYWFFAALIVVINLFSALTCYSNEPNYTFKQVDVDHGLPDSNLKDQIQDRDGIMWIAVESIGLCRYDGHRFHIYTHEPENSNSLSSAFVNKIIEDKNGLLWIATDMGLNSFDKKANQFQQYFSNTDADLSIPSNICHALFLDSKDQLWLGTDNGVALIDPNTKLITSILFNAENETQHPISVYAINEDRNGVIWLGTNKGLLKYNPINSQYLFFDSNTLPNQSKQPLKILSLLLVDHYLWIASLDGLYKFNLDAQKFDKIHFEPSQESYLRDVGFNSLMIDESGNIWAGTDSKGLVIINKDEFDIKIINNQTPLNYPLKSNHIRYLFADELGVIWVGTKFAGVFKYNTKINTFNCWPQQYKCLENLSNKYMLSFLEEEDGIFWLGTKHDGLFRVDCNQYKTTNFQHSDIVLNSLGSNRVNHIFRDSKSNLWLGTNTTLSLYNEQNNSFVNIGNYTVNWIHEDKTGLLWAATSNGVFIVDFTDFELKRFQSETSDLLFNNFDIDVLKIEEESNGNLWFLTRQNGVFRYSIINNKVEHFFTFPNSSAIKGDNMIRKIFIDSSKRTWIGTKTKGLFLFDNETNTFVNFGIEHGLPSNMILNIEEDNKGMLWLGTHNGISCFDPNSQTARNYNFEHGLKTNVCEINASTKLKNGFLLFGGNNGFNIFHPDLLTKLPAPKPIIITSVKVNEVEKANYISSNYSLQLNYKQSFISFEFTIPDYNNPLRHQFYVMLKGADSTWNQLGNRNYVSYSNLKPGAYSFLLKGVNEYGNVIYYNDEFLINIAQPFFHKALFQILFALLFLCLVAFIYFQIRKRQHKLEQMINERTRKLEIAYKELLSKNTKIREQNRQIEHHHQDLEQKVAERTRDLEIAKRKAEESDKLKSSFLANMSHEIRTPLNAISGFSTLVSSDMYSAERKHKYVDIIKANVTSLLKLVEDILDVSKIESGQLKIERDYFDFTNMIAEVNAIFQEEIRITHGKNVQLVCENSSSVDTNIEFNSDLVRIKQVLSNLLSNAIKFTKFGKIEFGYQLNERSIKMWVRDTGIGIKQDDIEHIFNRFTKIEEEKAIYRGTGLGLNISKSLVALLNGKIWVESELNIGSCFYFEIPGEIRIIHNWQSNIKKGKITKLNLAGKSVMLVEPEKSSYMLLHSFLLSTKVNITWAHNGKTASEFIQKQTFDFAIVDLRLTDIDCFALLKQIKNANPHTPVIAQTSYASPDEKKKITALGFNGFIIKPFSKEELFNVISQLF